MKSILVLLATMSFNANAEIDILNVGQLDKADAKLIIGIGSRHFDKVDHAILNEHNPSIGIEAWDVQAVYVNKNSWNKNSLYLTFAPDYVINNYITLSGQIGMANGYKCSNSVASGSMVYHNGYCSKSGVVPLAAATVSYYPTGNNFALSLSVNPEVAMFSMSYDLK